MKISAKTEAKLIHKNTKASPVELIIEIPLRTEIIFNYFIAKIKDKIIKSKVIESNKAEEKYNDAIASGNTGIKFNYDLQKRICSLKIGNLPEGEILELKFYFIQFVTIKNAFYCINLVKEFPHINNFNPNNFEGKIIIETFSKIINVLQNNKAKSKYYTPNYSNDKKKCEIEYVDNDLDKILFKTTDIEKNLLIKQYNNKLNETNYILNIIIIIIQIIINNILAYLLF